jgi:hypothetical protein
VRLLGMVHISGAEHRAENNIFGRGQRHLRS